MLCCVFVRLQYDTINPLNPRSDRHLNSPSNNVALSKIVVMRIKGNDQQVAEKILIVKQISSSVPQEMYGE